MIHIIAVDFSMFDYHLERVGESTDRYGLHGPIPTEDVVAAKIELGAMPKLNSGCS